MTTECNLFSFDFQPLGSREVVARFDGGRITSDAGALLLREIERATGIIRQFAACFTDHRDPELIEHTVQELIAQRVYGLAWDTRISTITTRCVTIRCWRCWSARRTPWGRTGCGCRTRARPWPARARSTAWN